MTERITHEEALKEASFISNSRGRTLMEMYIAQQQASESAPSDTVSGLALAPMHSEATGGGDYTSNCDACGAETEHGHTHKQCFEEGKNVGATDAGIECMVALNQALGCADEVRPWPEALAAARAEHEAALTEYRKVELLWKQAAVDREAAKADAERGWNEVHGLQAELGSAQLKLTALRAEHEAALVEYRKAEALWKKGAVDLVAAKEDAERGWNEVHGLQQELGAVRLQLTAQQAEHERVVGENSRLWAELNRVNLERDALKQRVEALEAAARRVVYFANLHRSLTAEEEKERLLLFKCFPPLSEAPASPSPAVGEKKPTCAVMAGATACGLEAEWLHVAGKFWACAKCFREYPPEVRGEEFVHKSALGNAQPSPSPQVAQAAVERMVERLIRLLKQQGFGWLDRSDVRQSFRSVLAEESAAHPQVAQVPVRMVPGHTNACNGESFPDGSGSPCDCEGMVPADDDENEEDNERALPFPDLATWCACGEEFIDPPGAILTVCASCGTARPSVAPTPAESQGRPEQAGDRRALWSQFIDAFCAAEHAWVQKRHDDTLSRLLTAVGKLARCVETDELERGSR